MNCPENRVRLPCPRQSAQRRPGFEPRRHESAGAVLAPLLRRSTKARVRTPATPGDIGAFLRSTKARVRTPATRPRPSENPSVAFPLNEGQGSNPGDTPQRSDRVRPAVARSTKARVRTPATPLPGQTHASDARALNEGQGFEPRRHVAGRWDASRHPPRSTKARVRTPATPRRYSACRACRTRAQRRPGFEPRRHQSRSDNRRASTASVRSTKARVRTPATRAGRRRRGSGRATLNEGQGSNPGDTIGVLLINVPFSSAQRRPGFEPRRHFRGDNRLPVRSDPAQRRPGFEPRRHRPRSSSRAPQGRDAQRRPGFEPRRHRFGRAA